MSYDCKIEEFIRNYSEEVRNSRAALFIGSGLSRSAGYVDWKGILREVAEDIKLKVEKETDLISLAEYYVNAKKNRSKIDNAISQFFSQDFSPTKTHELLATLPINDYWTTNYDRLIEKTLSNKYIRYSILTNDDSFRKFINGNDVVIHKLHGDVADPGNAVITKKDYEEFAFKHEILLAKLKGEMCSKSFLFLGYSFSDTDINHILTRIRLFYKGNPPKMHYCILEKIKKKNDESEEDFEYRKIKLEHHIIDLQSYGIQTVLVEDYDNDIPKILKKIKKLVYAKNVFISGAYEENNEKVELFNQLAKTISSYLISRQYKIYTGYGKSIGAEIIAGASEGYKVSIKHTPKIFNEEIFVYPFPYKSSLNSEDKKELYTNYRRNIIKKTQILILINGTKVISGKTVLSNGCIEEAQIGIEEGCLVIPVGATGGAAEKVWNQLNIESCKCSEDFIKLKEGKTFEQLYNAIINIIEKGKF